MIIALIIIGILIYFTLNIMGDFPGHKVIAYLALILALGSTIALIGHEKAHWGMKTTTTTKTVKIKSLTTQFNLVTYRKLGSGAQARIYVYKNTANKVAHTQANTNTKNYVHTSASNKTATIKVVEKRYVFKNGWNKLLFSIVGRNNQLKSRTNTFELPQSWQVLSTTQVQQFNQLMKKNAKKIQSAIATKVKTGLAAALKKNPTMTAKQRKQLQTKLTQQATAAQMAKYLAQVKK